MKQIYFRNRERLFEGRNKKQAKIVLMIGMALALVVNGMFAGTASVSAKKKNYTAFISISGRNFSVGNADVANAKIKNKKGKQKCVMTLKKSDSNSQPEEGAKIEIDDLAVYVDNILSEHKLKNVKISNVVVKCDGKKVKLNKKTIKPRMQSGEDETKRLCIPLYFQNYKLTKKFDFKKKMTVSFVINIKK